MLVEIERKISFQYTKVQKGEFLPSKKLLVAMLRTVLKFEVMEYKRALLPYGFFGIWHSNLVSIDECSVAATVVLLFGFRQA